MHRLPVSFPLLPDRESAPAGLVALLGDGVHHLRRGETIRLRPARPMALMVWAGRLWLTRTGDRVDHFPGPGQCVAIAAGADVVVEGDDARGSTFSLAAAEAAGADGARADGATRWSRWTARLRAHWRRRRAQAALARLSPGQLRDIGVDERLATRLWLQQAQRDAALQARLQQGGGW